MEHLMRMVTVQERNDKEVVFLLAGINVNESGGIGGGERT